MRQKARRNRGVALIIVLLVTALLIALIFEFAYSTRVSLRAAANYRDSQRAYFIARSGFGFFAKYPELQSNVSQGEWSPDLMSYAGESDAKLFIKWEDESGKINISNVTKGSDAYNRLQKLFEILRISQDKLDQISTWMQQELQSFYLISELHRFLSDEEYIKIAGFVTTAASGRININAAAPEVLQSLGLSAADAERIVQTAREKPYDDSGIATAPGMTIAISGYLTAASGSVFKVTARAAVGGYTKQIEAILTLKAPGYTVNYWRAL
ncbi:MAG TPA: hypothetical protein VK654_06730 [Nitrospirota bacterium]|nr:hypothetical protein [Nitrospirota bacterium]